MTLRLIDLEAPLDDVEFPDGTRHQPVPWGPAEYRLWRDIQQEPDATKRGELLMQIVSACYPTATADDLDSCTPTMLIAIAAHAGRKIEQVRDALKNADAAAAAAPASPPPTTAPSSPRTSGSTSSPKSRARSAKHGTASPAASPTAAPNSFGGTTTTSPKRSGSTNSGENSTTSTAPS